MDELLRPPSPPARAPPLPRLSDYSFSSVIDTGWASVDFMLSAGMVIIQQETHLVLLVHDMERDKWCLPRARKDLEEPLEMTALRAAYEMSGYQPSLLPLRTPCRHVAWNGHNTEPVYITVTAWQPMEGNHGKYDDGGEHLTTWYAGTIEPPEEAIWNSYNGTDMSDSDEQTSQTRLFSYEEALQKISQSEERVLRYVWFLYYYNLRDLRMKD